MRVAITLSAKLLGKLVTKFSLKYTSSNSSQNSNQHKGIKIFTQYLMIMIIGQGVNFAGLSRPYLRNYFQVFWDFTYSLSSHDSYSISVRKRIFRKCNGGINFGLTNFWYNR
jgi:hypothetical protein